MDFLKSVLIVGGGGREHALLKALLRSEQPLCLYAYPGNPGMESDGCMLVDQPIGQWDDLAQWAELNEIDLTVVGPEIPLVEGIVDTFKKHGLAIFGPDKMAAELEGSKAFSKNLMKKYSIPTAAYEVFSNGADAQAYLEKVGAPVVIKASGLAAGKGAMVCATMDEAREALGLCFESNAFGEAGQTVVIEEMLYGQEASVFVLTDGKSWRILPVSQDHKRIGEGDSGPNTGGMGAYAPAPLVDKKMLAIIEDTIIKPTLDAMKAEGRTYRGLLYAGIMVTEKGPKVIEFNCRFGDPETQAVLPLVQCDWYELLRACATGRLHEVQWQVRPGACVSVVLASKGYPGAYEKGKLMSGLDSAEQHVENVDVYHAGTALDEEGNFVTNGGRVVAVSAWSETLEEAIADAYIAVSKIEFEGKTFRRDIAAKGLTRPKR